MEDVSYLNKHLVILEAVALCDACCLTLRCELNVNLMFGMRCCVHPSLENTW